MRIETLICHEWQTCEHKNWAELIEDGWRFIEFTQENTVIMERNGYFNEFRNKRDKK